MRYLCELAEFSYLSFSEAITLKNTFITKIKVIHSSNDRQKAKKNPKLDLINLKDQSQSKENVADYFHRTCDLNKKVHCHLHGLKMRLNRRRLQILWTKIWVIR